MQSAKKLRTSLGATARAGLASLIFVALFLGHSAGAAAQADQASAVPAATDPATAQADAKLVVPQQVRYAGKFAARSGEAVEAVFRIYAAAEGGEPLWTETQQVSVAADGSYSVLLGGATQAGLPQTVFSGGAARWLGVTVERSEEQERVPLSSVPYAMKSADAESLAGHQAADFVTQEQLAGLSQQMNEKVSKAEQAAATPAFQPELAPSGSGTTNTVPLWTSSSTLGNSVITDLGSKIGINFAAPTATLEVGGAMTVHGTLTFPPGVPATPAASSQSQSFSFSASAWDSTTSAPVSSTYTLLAGPVGNNTATPNAVLYLNYQNGTSPVTSLFTISGKGLLGLANPAGGISSYGNISLSPLNWATSTASSNSPLLEIGASSFSSTTNAARGQTFAWQAQAAGNDTASPTGSLALLFGENGSAPAATGFSLAANGQITFAPGQTFPGTTAAITGIVPASPLTGGGTSGSIALGLNETTLVTDIASSIETAIEPSLQTGFNSVYAQLGAPNTFTANQSITGTLGVSGALTSGSTSTGALSAASESLSGASSAAGGYQSTGDVTVKPATPATTSAGANSPLLEIGASSWWTTSGAPRAQNFAWQALAGDNDTATPDGTLALLFGSGSGTPVATGLAIAQNGQISFAAGQTFPGTGTGNGTITGISTTGPLTGSGTSGSVALSLNTSALETTLNNVYPQLGTGNTFTGNQTITGNATVSGTLSAGATTLGNTNTGSLNAGGKIFGNYSIGVEPSNTATPSGGFDSFLQSYASVYNSSSATATTPWLAWHGVPVGNNTASPGIALDLAYGPGNGSYSKTGLSIAQTGVISFASGQTFPGAGSGTITGVTTTSPLAGSGTTGSVALSLDTSALETTLNSVYARVTGSGNTFTGTQTITGITTGILSTATGAGGTAIYATAGSSTGTGVSSTGGGYGVVGTSTSATGIGVEGAGNYGVEALGQAYGVYATASGANSAGVQATGAEYGVYGSGGTVGLYGTTSQEPGTAGVFGQGAIGVQGFGTTDGLMGQTTTPGGSGVYGAGLGTGGYGVYGNGGQFGLYGTTNQGAGTAGVYGLGSVGVQGSGTTYGVQGGTTTTNGAGIYGSGTGSGGYGVYGIGTKFGLYGVANQATLSAGVYGSGSVGVQGGGTQYGVQGGSTASNGAGVYGSSTGGGNAAGVSGTASQYGVYGNATGGGNAAGVYGTAPDFGVYGISTGGKDTVGVYGQGGYGMQAGGTQYGVYATTASSASGIAGIYGVYGSPSASGSGGGLAGVWADTNQSEGDGGSALLATADDNFAADFFNNSNTASTIYVINNGSGGGGNAVPAVIVARGHNGLCAMTTSGDTSCTGTLKTVNTNTDQTKVETYAVQSAENWIEDYGAATLSHGVAVVRIDSTFAKTINTGMDFHVFLTPGGDCKGLYVTNKTADSFEVRELGGGVSSISFDYKIVAKRRGFETQRLVDVTERDRQMQEHLPKGSRSRSMQAPASEAN